MDRRAFMKMSTLGLAGLGRFAVTRSTLGRAVLGGASIGGATLGAVSAPDPAAAQQAGTWAGYDLAQPVYVSGGVTYLRWGAAAHGVVGEMHLMLGDTSMPRDLPARRAPNGADAAQLAGLVASARPYVGPHHVLRLMMAGSGWEQLRDGRALHEGALVGAIGVLSTGFAQTLWPQILWLPDGKSVWQAPPVA